jgi:hypothetical protein
MECVNRLAPVLCELYEWREPGSIHSIPLGLTWRLLPGIFPSPSLVNFLENRIRFRLRSFKAERFFYTYLKLFLTIGIFYFALFENTTYIFLLYTYEDYRYALRNEKERRKNMICSLALDVNSSS